MLPLPDKLQVYHFHNGSGGGILSVIKNLISFSDNSKIENHIIYTINKDLQNEFKIEKVEKVITEQVFYYSSKNNFYYTCNQLAKLLPNEDALIVAHDWMELGMVSNLGLQNRVVHYVHGDYEYYYNLAFKNASIIDSFITVSKSIKNNLIKKIVHRINDISYLRFPVQNVESLEKSTKFGNKIVFVGRCEPAKGYFLLPQIATKLNAYSKNFEWHIVGEKSKNKKDELIWPNNVKVKFYGSIDNKKVLELLSNMDFFLLPSISEGMPVSLIEAMKSGVIPFVNNWGEAVFELIEVDKTGFIIKDNDVDEFVREIVSISNNESKMNEMRQLAIEKANNLFNPQKNVQAIEALFLTIEKNSKNNANKKYGSRLDQPWIPNFITKTIRSFLYG